MQKSDLEVIEKSIEFLEKGKSLKFCTIIDKKGASTRPLGSLFACSSYDEDEYFGFISSPLMDKAFVEILKQKEFSKDLEYYTYGNHLLPNTQGLNLPCCGYVKILIENLSPNEENISKQKEFLKLCKKRENFTKILDLKTKKTTFLKSVITAKSVEVMQNEISFAYQPVPRFLILGASLVSKYLVKMALELEFEVKICDTREVLISSWDYNAKVGGVDIEIINPRDFIKKYSDKNSIVLALAHDPSLDDEGLIEAFLNQAFYIGAIGSAKNTQKRLDRFRQRDDFKEEFLQKLNAPVGLEIFAKIPAQIAISIMAEVLKVLNSKKN